LRKGLIFSGAISIVGQLKPFGSEVMKDPASLNGKAIYQRKKGGGLYERMSFIMLTTNGGE
jgi:hypothetical protein